ncbi:MAG: DUF6055 domain-containing protein [Myxococcota bacterium]
MPLPFVPFCDTPLRLAELAADPPPLAEERPAYAASEVCIDPQELADGEGLRGTFDQTLDTAHFHLAWDAENRVVDEALVDVYAAAAERAWEFQIDRLGWKAPDQTDTCLITLLIADFSDADSGTGGYTNVERTGGVPYIILNTDWAEYGDPWTETLVTHEFNHASQFAYDVFWEESDWWYWESSAEWVPYEDYDYPDVWMWSLSYYLDAPWRSLDSYSGLSQYGHWVYNRHLSETYGQDVVQAIWATAGARDSVADAVDAALANDGVTFEDTVLGFSSHAAAMDFEEGDVWLEALGYFEALGYWEADDYAPTVSTYPASGEAPERGAPQEHGQSFVHFTGSADAVLAFAGDATVDDVDADWAITVAAADGSGGFVHTSDRAAADGTATVTLPLATSGDVYVAFVPMGGIGERGAQYTWSAAVDEGGGDDTGSPAGDDTGADTDRPPKQDDDGEEPGGCGCDGGASPAGLVWLAGAALAARRRRPA